LVCAALLRHVLPRVECCQLNASRIQIITADNWSHTLLGVDLPRLQTLHLAKGRGPAHSSPALKTSAATYSIGVLHRLIACPPEA
jgi:hypothetical protein